MGITQTAAYRTLLEDCWFWCKTRSGGRRDNFFPVLSQSNDDAKKKGYALKMRQDPPELGEHYGDIKIKATDGYEGL